MVNFSAVAASCEALPHALVGQFFPRTWQHVRLGPLQVAFRSNEDVFAELRHFPESAHLPRDAPVHYTVNCCNVNIDGLWPLQQLKKAHDGTYRGKRFAAGYYLTDHFGPPAYLITQGSELWIFAARFAPILWPFVVKFLLTKFSIEQRMLHLKAAAVSLSNEATLLVGRGGTGKTVLVTQLCQNSGAHFLANTHVLVHEETVIPVASSMRIRNDRLFGPLIAARALPEAIKAGEFLADPYADLGWSIGKACRIRNICLVDYRGDGRRVIGTVDREVLLDYMESFSLAVNIYGLREDVLDYLGGDVRRFSTESSYMNAELQRLIERCRCFYVSCDVTDANNLRAIGEMLSEDGPQHEVRG